MTIKATWRGAFTNEETNLLHAEAFETRSMAAQLLSLVDAVDLRP